MEKHEIIKAYGTDFKEMTKRLLEYSNLEKEIEKKAEKLSEKLKAENRTAKNIKIAIKPNVLGCNPSMFGATTHSEIVAGIIEYLKARDYQNIVIAEGSWVGDKTYKAFDICGYNALSEEYGVPLIDTQK